MYVCVCVCLAGRGCLKGRPDIGGLAGRSVTQPLQPMVPWGTYPLGNQQPMSGSGLAVHNHTPFGVGLRNKANWTGPLNTSLFKSKRRLVESTMRGDPPNDCTAPAAHAHCAAPPPPPDPPRLSERPVQRVHKRSVGRCASHTLSDTADGQACSCRNAAVRNETLRNPQEGAGPEGNRGTLCLYSASRGGPCTPCLSPHDGEMCFGRWEWDSCPSAYGCCSCPSGGNSSAGAGGHHVQSFPRGGSPPLCGDCNARGSASPMDTNNWTLSASWSWDVLYFKGWWLAAGSWWLVAVGGWQRLVVGSGWWLAAVGGWQLVAVGGWQRLVVGSGWWLAAVSGWQRLVVGSGWWLAAVGCRQRLVVGSGWWLAAVGGWQRLAVGNGWQLAVGGPWRLSSIWLREDSPSGHMHAHTDGHTQARPRRHLPVHTPATACNLPWV